MSNTGKRIRRASDMKHVVQVEALPEDNRYIPLRKFMAACPASRENKIKYKNAIHYLVERQFLHVVAKQVNERARRLYDKEQIPFVRAVLSMHQNGLTLDKAVEIAGRRNDHDRKGRLF